MKKLLLVSAVLLGATASQAGVHLNIGFPLPALPLPPLPGIVIGRPAPRAYYDAPRDDYQAPPACYDSPRVVVAPPIVRFGSGSDWGYRGSYGYRDRQHYTYRGSDCRDRDHRRGHHDSHRRW